jgi:hypothetical protein
MNRRAQIIATSSERRWCPGRRVAAASLLANPVHRRAPWNNDLAGRVPTGTLQCGEAALPMLFRKSPFSIQLTTAPGHRLPRPFNPPNNSAKYAPFYAAGNTSAGTDVHSVQTILGHSVPSTTLNIYGHAVAGLQAKAVMMIDENLASAQEQRRIAGENG